MPLLSLLALSALVVVFVGARAAQRSRRINLPTSKSLTLPVPGYLGRTNSFPATIALSPDGRYAAFLNQGIRHAGNRRSPVDRDSRSQKQSGCAISLTTGSAMKQPPTRATLSALHFRAMGNIFMRRWGQSLILLEPSQRAQGMASRCIDLQMERLLRSGLSKLLRSDSPMGNSGFIWCAQDRSRNRIALSGGICCRARPKGRSIARCQQYFRQCSTSGCCLRHGRAVIRPKPEPLHSERISVHRSC